MASRSSSSAQAVGGSFGQVGGLRQPGGGQALTLRLDLTSLGKLGALGFDLQAGLVDGLLAATQVLGLGGQVSLLFQQQGLGLGEVSHHDALAVAHLSQVGTDAAHIRAQVVPVEVPNGQAPDQGEQDQ